MSFVTHTLDGFYEQWLANPGREPGKVIAIFERPTSRTCGSVIRPTTESDALAIGRRWELWWAASHCVGYFDDEQARTMLTQRQPGTVLRAVDEQAIPWKAECR
jgi:hypothetical protein